MLPNACAETHEVTNQVPPLDGANLYRLDVPLQTVGRALRRRLGRAAR